MMRASVVDVDRRERVVEDQQARRAGRRGGEGARQADALPLAARDPDAELPDLGVEARAGTPRHPASIAASRIARR